MRLTGTLTQISETPYAFRGEDGREVVGTSHHLHVLESGTSLVRVKVPQARVGDLALFSLGETVDLAVTVQANAGARGAYLSVSYAGLFEHAPALAS